MLESSVKTRVEDVFDLIHEIDATGQGLPAAAEKQIRLKSGRLESEEAAVE